MTNQLKRIQIYVDQENLSVVDKIAQDGKMTRSKVIRDFIKTGTEKVIKKEKSKPKKFKSVLMEMAGKGGISKTGTIGLNIDEIYLND